jgi:Beta-propeller repeat
MKRRQKITRHFLCVEALEGRLCLASSGASQSLFGFGWADRAGSTTGQVFGSAVATDPSGNVYVTGGFSGTVDFGPGPGATTLTDSGPDDDTYLAKYSSTGPVLWVKDWGDRPVTTPGPSQSTMPGMCTWRGRSMALPFWVRVKPTRPH